MSNARPAAGGNRKRRGRYQPPHWPLEGDYSTTTDRRVRFGVVVAGYLDSIMRSVAARDLGQTRSELRSLQRLVDEADARPKQGSGPWRGVLYGAQPKALQWRGSHAVVMPDNVVLLDAVRRKRMEGAQ